jgi:hypothetical protein
MFEYINYKPHTTSATYNESIVMTVTNCIGASNVLATPSYSDMMTGQMSEIASEWSGDGVTAALVHIPRGYYYFGVKPANNRVSKQMFRVNVQSASTINGDTVILKSLFYIN